MSVYIKYIKRAVEMGAREAKVIAPSSIVAAEWVRLKCQFGCDGYGQSLTCPPYSPTAEVTRRVLASYKKALLVHGDEYTDIHALIPALEREIFLDGYYKAFGMAAGPCQLCAKCAKFCRHPEKTTSVNGGLRHRRLFHGARQRLSDKGGFFCELQRELLRDRFD